MEGTAQPDVVTGSVVEGVEHGSVVLVADTGATYQIGRRWQHLVGRRVRVTGHILRDVMTTAQQGVPFNVDEATDVGEGTAQAPRTGLGPV